jgi:hypothetical protein
MKKTLLFFCIMALSFFMFASPLFAFTFDGGRTVNVREDIDDNLYLWGGAISVRNSVNGDLFVAGGRFNLNGDVADDLTAIGAFGYVGGNVGGDVKVLGGVVTLNGLINGEVMVAGGVVIIDTNCLVSGDLAITGGSLNILGEVTGDLVATGGSIEILGDIRGNAEIKNAGSLNIRNTATIGGDLIYSSGKEAGISQGAEIKGNIIYNETVTTPAKVQAKATELFKTRGPGNSLISYAAALDTEVISNSTRQTLLTIAADKTKEQDQTFWGAVTEFFSGFFIAAYITLKAFYFVWMFIFGIVLIRALPALFKRFNDRMRSSFARCVTGGAINLFGVPIGMVIIWAVASILLLTIIGAAFGIILFAAWGIIGIIYGVLIFVSTIFLSYLTGELILYKSKLDTSKYGVKVLAFFIGFIILEIIYAIPVIGQVAQLAGILFGLGGISIIIYEWIRYKNNPFSNQVTPGTADGGLKK